MRLAPLYQEDRARAIQQGRQEGIQRESNLVIRLLNRRLGSLSPDLEQQVRELPLNTYSTQTPNIRAEWYSAPTRII
ncbi:MAG: DUF4351 domain-containing protein [Microcystaceae cyanobacterium]